MPSIYPEPTIAELIEAFWDGVRGNGERYVDAREGAVYEHFAGMAAVMWSRCARRDTDLWRAIYLDSAEGRDLTRALEQRYGFARIEDSYGTGTARLRRPTAAAADGSVWKGTRLLVSGAQTPRRYVVSQDTAIAAGDLEVVVPIRAEQSASGSAISYSANDGTSYARVEDPLWDTSWMVASLECGDGTSFEPAAQARARFRESRRASRAGFVDAITAACRAAGAVNAVLFPSDYSGDAFDVGINMAYVGDANFHGDVRLVRRVTQALEDVRVLGDNMQVRALSRFDLAIRARVHLWEAPSLVNLSQVRTLIVGALQGAFDGTSGGFGFTREALMGAMIRAVPIVQTVDFDEPASDAGVFSSTDGFATFPATLSRYQVRDADVTLTFLPPV